MQKKPAQQHTANGTFKPSRHRTPTLPIVAPPMPPDLPLEAQAAWNLVAPRLERAGLVSEIDQHALRLLCESFCVYLEATDAVRKEGIVVEQTNKGGHTNKVPNPAVRVRAQAWKEVVTLMRQFGMTPVARTGIDFGDVTDDQSEEERVAGILKFHA